jgi:hypothetical protein
MKNQALILFLMIISFSASFGQSKKAQIEQLNYRVDSLIRVLGSERSTNKQQKAFLDRQIVELNTNITKLKVELSALKTKTDSLMTIVIGNKDKTVAPTIGDEDEAEVVPVYIPMPGETEAFNDVPEDQSYPAPDHGALETFVDEEAEFPGGYPAMMAWIQNNLVRPETAIENNVQGKCFLRFVVSVDGSISSVTVTKGVPDCPECDKAAVKAMNSMPNWKPGKLNGRSVASYASIPINFAMD